MKFVSLLLLPFAAGLLPGAPYFEPNRGQSQTAAKFIGRSAHGLAALESSRLRLRTATGAAIGVTLDAANASAEGSGADPLPGVSHYALTRDPSSWIFGVPHFAAVRFQNVYRDVDLRFHYSGDDLEFDFDAAHPADISQIRLRFDEAVRLSSDGDLTLPEGRVQRPVAWQILAGKRQPVDVAFRPVDAHLVGFRLGPHDPAQPVVIDPTVDFGTFLGGSGGELDTQLAVDSSGNIYMAGATLSTDFPAAELPGYPLNVPVSLRSADVYITRLKPDASTIDWSFFIGGTATERALGLALDSIGDVYLYGSTLSANFPVTPNAWKTTIDSTVTDTFVAKFNAQTGLLLAATYLGFPLSDFRPNAYGSTAFAVDSAGGVYVGGSPGAAFQPTSGAYSTAAGLYAIVRLNAALTNPVYATYFPLGKPNVLHTDAAGNLIVTGYSAYSNSGTFPAVNPIDGVNPTFPHDFIAKLNSAGSSLTYASLLPGPLGDVQVDASGNAWIAGIATSDVPRVHSLVPAPSPAVHPGIGSGPAYFAEIPPQGGAFLQSTVFDSSDYWTSSNTTSQPSTKLVFPAGRVCVLNVPVKSPTPGSLATTGSTQSLVCSDAAQSAIEMRTLLPDAFYNAAQASPDGAVLLAGSGGNSFPATRGVVQPAFAGGTFTNDPFTLFGNDAILLRLSFPSPIPVISSMTTDTVLLNSSGNPPSVGSLTLLGSGFSYGEQLTLNGNPLTVSSVDSPNKITVASIPLTALQLGANQIVATTPGAGASNSAVITAYNPTPASLTISPATLTAGAPETKIIVSGTGIIASSVLTWNGQVRATTFVPSTQPGSVTGTLQFLVEPSELTQPSVSTATITNPAPGGGTSPSARFVVQDAAATAVPSLSTTTIFVPFSDSAAPAATVTVNGSGLNASTTATWDGVVVPVSYVSATQIKITPPSGALSTIGAHQIQAANQGFTSNVATLTVSRVTGQSSYAYDPVKQLLYLLVPPAPPNYSPRGPFDLEVIDARTGKQIAGITRLISSAPAVAVSADGNYVYIGGGDTGLEIKRFNTNTSSIDLDFQVQGAPDIVGAHILALGVIAGAPETLAVAMGNTSPGGYTLSIYDRDRPRPLSMPLPSTSGAPVLLATTDKVFVVNASLPSCIAWMNFDGGGVESSTQCGANPPEMRSSHGFVWLTDGVRNAVISAPSGIGNSNQVALTWQIDPTRSAAWAISASSPILLYRVDLNTMVQTITPASYAGTFAGVLLGGDGAVRMLSASYLTAPPSAAAEPAAFRPTALRNPAERQLRRPVQLRR